MAFASGVDLIPTAQESPSMWAPGSPGLQQQLNSEFAPQVGLLAADPSPPPMLFLPAEGSPVQPVSNIPSLPIGNLPWNGSPFSPQLRAESSTLDPSLNVQATGEVSSLLLPQPGTYDPVSSDVDAYVPNTDGFLLEPAHTITAQLQSGASEIFRHAVVDDVTPTDLVVTPWL